MKVQKKSRSVLILRTYNISTLYIPSSIEPFSTPLSTITGLASGAYRSVRTANSTKPMQQMTPRQVIQEFQECYLFRTERFDLVYRRLLRRFRHEQRVYRRKAEKEARLRLQGRTKWNMDYSELRLEYGGVKCLVLEAVLELQKVYGNWIELVKNSEDPYLVGTEKLALGARCEILFADVYDVLKQVTWLAEQRDKLREERRNKWWVVVGWLEMKMGVS